MSETAKALLKDLLPQRPEPDQVFRLSRQGNAFGLRFDAPAEGDVVFEHEGVNILAISPDVAEGLDGTIEREDSPDGPRLILQR